MVTKWSPSGGRHGEPVVFANSPITGYLPPTSRPEACSWELDPPEIENGTHCNKL